jgi:2-iminobutanoate/2-iminopropanoate deaminase
MKRLFHFVLFFVTVCVYTQEKKILQSDKAPLPIGPYSQAVYSEPWIFLSGQIGMDAKGKMDTISVEKQARQVFENIRHILESAGADMQHVVKVTIYLKNMSDFPLVNKIYSEYFREPYPARETVEVCRLPRNAKIEVSVIARIQ